jgi:6-pyruvoyltetrahydropterin/6-carboxytetrahydropterin synthase
MSDTGPPDEPSTGRHEVFTEIGFEAAHRLPNVPEGHKCARLHGHSYRVQVTVGGPLHPELGWVVDFGDVRAACEPVRDALDHHYLNELPGLENPTSEVLAGWIWDRLVGALPGLVAVTVRETCTSGSTFRG